MIKKALENIIRNWTVTVPTVLVIAIILTMFHGLLAINSKAKKTLQIVEQKFSITIYLKDSADPFEVGNLITALEKRADVKKPVIYTSKEEAWASVSKNFSLDNELLQKYKFSLPASLTVTPISPKDAQAIEAFIKTAGTVLLHEQAQIGDKQKNLTAQMSDFVKNVKDSTLKTMLFFIIIFIVGGTLLVSSTIHLAISSRRKEITIMKLVGAPHSAITAPFLLEGLFIGLFAFLVNLVLIVVLPFTEMAAKQNLNAMLTELFVSVLLCVVVSYITAKLHLGSKIFI